VKIIEAIIRPHKLEDVRETLMESGIQGMTISEDHGLGRQKGHTETYRGAVYNTEFLPKIKLEVVVTDNLLQTASGIVVKKGKTGKVGDGKIFISTIDEAIRIRTQESSDSVVK
jgi:nitrogen regulatory protein P-II 1